MFPGKFKEPTTQIKNLDQLIGDKLNVKVKKHTAEPLTQFGENFGSEILKVNITVEEHDGTEREIHAVAKLIPPTEMQLEIFNTQVTFKNEIGFYEEIVGAMRDFQREHGVEPTKAFAELYGARINLEPGSHKVDNDGIIVMENLKIAGFDVIDRFEGFDLNGAKKILTTIAEFHATVLAIKIKKPEIFHTKINPYLTELVLDKAPPFELGNLLEQNPATAHLASKVKQKIVEKKHVKKQREPWATISHNDLWVNNIMVKKSRDGDIQEVKLVDFQAPDLASPACDLLFFLFSSVQEPVLRFHFDRLVQWYFKEAINTLSKYKVNLEQFTFESFKEELKAESHREMYHAMFMLNVVLGPKGGLPEMPGKAPEWSPNGNSNPRKQAATNDFMKAKFPAGFREKVCCFVELAEKQKWI
ncbi:uncharacterized protein LOC126734894 [Anthonomus grandis grandis]|uniref:uncharacterized protein LOC126734894 n=1 Tax=Anthonomus grandis grandis TaxID=2921223 RepID=UPI00216681B8|nr:uncharacterized protein LOC126734894 [Anthonomus grandis grandis]